MSSSIARPACRVSGKPNQTVPPCSLFSSQLLCRAFSCLSHVSRSQVRQVSSPETSQCLSHCFFRVRLSVSVRKLRLFKSWNGFDRWLLQYMTRHCRPKRQFRHSDFRPLSNEDRKGETIPFFTTDSIKARQNNSTLCSRNMFFFLSYSQIYFETPWRCPNHRVGDHCLWTPGLPINWQLTPPRSLHCSQLQHGATGEVTHLWPADGALALRQQWEQHHQQVMDAPAVTHTLYRSPDTPW